jgi:hypothetical protein
MSVKIHPKDFSDPRLISHGIRKLTINTFKKKNKIHPLYEASNNKSCMFCNIM